jgi:hypothetical protein
MSTTDLAAIWGLEGNKLRHALVCVKRMGKTEPLSTKYSRDDPTVSKDKPCHVKGFGVSLS